MRAVLLATGETLPAWGRSASACPAVAKGEEFVTRTLVRGVVSMLCVLGFTEGVLLGGVTAKGSSHTLSFLP